MGSSQENRAAIGLRIVDAIGNTDTFGGGTEVVIVDGCGGSLPFSAGVLEVANQLPLFGIHAQHRIAVLVELIPLPAEITELAVAVGSGTGGDRLTVLRLTSIPSRLSCRAIFSVVFRVHFMSLIGSPAVSLSISFWIASITAGVFFPLVCGLPLQPAPGPPLRPGPIVAVVL